MVTATGLGSGLDINALVTGIVDAERVPLMERLDSRKSDVDGLVTGFDSLTGTLSSIRDAIANLVDSNKLNATTAESTQSSVVSATASATAQTGTYEVNVSQLAETQSLISGNFTATSDVVGSGTLAIAIGTPTYNSSPNDGTYASFTQTSTVNVNIPTNATLADVRDAINSSSASVNASILFDGSNYRLMLNSKSTGAAQGIALTVSGDSAGSDTDTSGLSQLAFDTATTNLTQVREPKNASLTINGVSLTSTSNTVTNVVDGLSLTLHGTSSSSATVAIAHDSAAVIDSINAFVTAYNTHNGSQKSLTKYDVTTGDVGVLQGDAMTRTILTQLRSMITTEITGLTGTVSKLTDLGITVQSDGSLKVDEATLETAVTTNFASVEKFFLGETVSGVAITGFGTQLDALLDGFLDPDGSITEKLTSLGSKLEDIEADRTLYTRRMEALEERYYRQFNAMDTLLGQLTTTGEMLKNQLDALPGYQNLRQSGNR
jgi:flagellar hook-associated protein 2